MTKSKKFSRIAAIALSAVLALGVFVMANASVGSASAAAYASSYNSKQDAIDAGARLNKQIAEEGMVLLKNNGALPLYASKANPSKVSVFGYASVSPAGGGSTDGDTSAGVVKLQSDLYSSLKDAGFVTNPQVRAKYDAWKAAKKTSDYAIKDEFNAQMDSVKSSFKQYGDAAIVMLSSDSANVNLTGDASMSDAKAHSRQLDRSQYEGIINYVAAEFDKVIVLVNNSVAIELGVLEDNDKVDAVLLVGEPGDNGFDAVGEILCGAVNPSGRLPDTYAADFMKIPSTKNYNWKVDHSAGYNRYKVGENFTDTYYVEYEEGIYVGYRYYETAAYEASQGNYDGFVYDDEVVYPFGYGLSYTDFTWDVTPKTPAGAITENTNLVFDVKVTNTGKRAGKEVVQLYYTAPYTNRGIEKAHVVLGDFVKTDILKPGDSQTVSLSIRGEDMKSYDMNGDGKYVLEDGTYTLRVLKNAHDWTDTNSYKIDYTVGSDINITKSETGYTVKNQFDEMTDHMKNTADKQFSRSDFKATFPTEAVQYTLTEEQYKAWAVDVNAEYDNGAPWAATAMPNQAKADTRPAKAEVTLDKLIGKSYDDPLWETLLDQLTIEEMKELIEYGGFQSLDIPYIGKPFTFDTDGPKGWTGNGTTGTAFNKFAAEPVVAATFNKELAYEMGKMIGEQGLWGSSDSGEAMTYTGWYAPAMNTHRSPFDNRYTEYYSEDGLLAGIMAAEASLGANSKGAYVFIKHFALHDDGGGTAISFVDGNMSVAGYRGAMNTSKTSGLSVWADEQTVREVYLKPFQLAVEKGEARAAMSAFNRFGSTWAGGSYELLTEVLRNEWGFKGFVVTDIAIYGFLDGDQMIRAGGDLVLQSSMGDSTKCGKVGGNDYTAQYNATQVTAMRKAAKNILYTVANSNAMQTPKGAKVNYEAKEAGAAKVGEAYTLDVTGAVLNTKSDYSAVVYSVVSGKLPAGLTLTDGVITGTPAEAGRYTFTVEASADGYESATAEFTVVVSADGKGGKDGGCGGEVAAASMSAALIALIGAGAVTLAGRKKRA